MINHIPNNNKYYFDIYSTKERIYKNIVGSSCRDMRVFNYKMSQSNKKLVNKNDSVHNNCLLLKLGCNDDDRIFIFENKKRKLQNLKIGLCINEKSIINDFKQNLKFLSHLKYYKNITKLSIFITYVNSYIITNRTLITKLFKQITDYITHHCNNLEIIKIYNLIDRDGYFIVEGYDEYYGIDYMTRQFAKYLCKLKIVKYFTKYCVKMRDLQENEKSQICCNDKETRLKWASDNGYYQHIPQLDNSNIIKHVAKKLQIMNRRFNNYNFNFIYIDSYNEPWLANLHLHQEFRQQFH